MLSSVRSYATDKVQPQFMFFDKIENKIVVFFVFWLKHEKLLKSILE